MSDKIKLDAEHLWVRPETVEYLLKRFLRTANDKSYSQTTFSILDSESDPVNDYAITIRSEVNNFANTTYAMPKRLSLDQAVDHIVSMVNAVYYSRGMFDTMKNVPPVPQQILHKVDEEYVKITRISKLEEAISEINEFRDNAKGNKEKEV